MTSPTSPAPSRLQQILDARNKAIKESIASAQGGVSGPKIDAASILAKLRQQKELPHRKPEVIADAIAALPEPEAPSLSSLLMQDKYGNPITLNENQQKFVSIASSGASSILIGAAGTGKTTCMRGVASGLLQSGRIPILQDSSHKHLKVGTPGIVFCAYTRRATNNLRRNLPADLQNNAITIHKLLEYAPVYYEIDDPETGEVRKTMLFEPSRNALNPLPQEIKCIVFEESSMIGTDLYKEVMEALPHEVQVIFLGDIQQLPPVFGAAILGFKMLELPVVELTEVYRQALESPIIRLAHRILSGKAIYPEEFDEWKYPGQLTLRPWKRTISDHLAALTAIKFLTLAIEDGSYDPEQDLALIPYNVAFGCEAVNKGVANFLARKNDRVTWEVIAGFRKHYYSVGDKVLYDKEDCVILDIQPNESYTGALPQPPSKFLDYEGHILPGGTAHKLSEDDVDFLMAQVARAQEERVTLASHKVKILRLDSGVETTLDKAEEINSLSLGYAITVHKSQGSEARKVFVFLHHTHAKMVQRELLYTAVTRAREELYVICESNSFVKGILNQRIKGNTLEEKAAYFKGKLEENDGAY